MFLLKSHDFSNIYTSSVCPVLGREECEKYHIEPELSFFLVMVVIYFMFVVGARQGFPVTNVSFTPSDDSVKKTESY